MDKLIRVLVVDDSAYIRKVVKQMLERSPFIEVVGTAFNGIDALEKVIELDPDVITLDLIMPEMNGVEFLIEQMKRKPYPVVITSIASETGGMALEALEAGAIDFIQKPTALATEKIFEIADEMIEKVKAASFIPMDKVIKPETKSKKTKVSKVINRVSLGKFDILVIGVSTGGPQALRLLIPQLPKDFPIPIVLVLHMPVGYTELYAQKLNEISKLEVLEAQEGMEIIPGRVIIGQAGKHITFIKTADGTIISHLDTRPFDTPHRPAVDVLFRSAADIFGKKVLALVLTGMGSDGRDGCLWIKSQGGTVFTESEETCVVYGMPRSVDEAQLSDKSIPLYNMIKTILEEV